MQAIINVAILGTPNNTSHVATFTAVGNLDNIVIGCLQSPISIVPTDIVCVLLKRNENIIPISNVNLIMNTLPINNPNDLPVPVLVPVPIPVPGTK